MMKCSLSRAFGDVNILGSGLAGPTWRSWLAILKAAFGEPLSAGEAKVFDRLAGGRAAPSDRVAELWVLAGRRAGKSRMAAFVSAFVGSCIDHRENLSAGEAGHVLTLAPSRAQAGVVHGYVAGFLEGSPLLRRQVVDATAEEIRLRGGVVVGTRAANFRTVRGPTLLAAVFDECAFWRDETSASPDLEVYRAVLPALASTGGILVGIGSPYRRAGLLHQKFAQSFGKDDPRVLVVRGPTLALNPTIDRGVIDAARADDPTAALSEWDAEFRSDLSQFLDDELIDAAIEHGRPAELPPIRKVDRGGQPPTYCAFVDPSGGRHDAFTLAIGHALDDRVVLDAVRGRAPPFDPQSVVAEYAALLRDYGVTKVVGDNYSGEWAVSAFAAEGVTYERSEKPKSQLYLEALPIFARGHISIPDHPRLLRELRLLERRTHRSGKDTVDHGPSGSDDYANALAGVIWLASGNANDLSYVEDLSWVGSYGEQSSEEELAQWRRQNYWSQYPTRGW